MQLSKNVTLDFACYSATAKRRKINNLTNNPKIIANIQFAANAIYEPLFEEFGGKIQRNSWYRCPILNKIVGGSKNSFHPLGCAIDFDGIMGVTNRQIYDFILHELDFTELVWEGENLDWVHVAIIKGREHEKNIKKIINP